jgi:uncharacterized protein YbjT (DUF2867 family)
VAVELESAPDGTGDVDRGIRVDLALPHVLGTSDMNILVLGASGGVGGSLVQQALERGHSVRALVRAGTAYRSPPGAEVLRGDPRHEAALAAALEGVDAVASGLGQRRAGRRLWSAALSPSDLMERVADALVPAMERAGVQRLVVVSAAGVGDSARRLTGPVRWLVRQGRIAEAYRDLASMERRLERSALDWLALRPVTLVDGRPTGRGREVERYRFTSTVRRSDVAAEMLKALASPVAFWRRTVLLGS